MSLDIVHEKKIRIQCKMNMSHGILTYKVNIVQELCAQMGKTNRQTETADKLVKYTALKKETRRKRTT